MCQQISNQAQSHPAHEPFTSGTINKKPSNHAKKSIPWWTKMTKWQEMHTKLSYLQWLCWLSVGVHSNLHNIGLFYQQPYESILYSLYLQPAIPQLSRRAARSSLNFLLLGSSKNTHNRGEVWLIQNNQDLRLLMYSSFHLMQLWEQFLWGKSLSLLSICVCMCVCYYSISNILARNTFNVTQ